MYKSAITCSVSGAVQLDRGFLGNPAGVDLASDVDVVVRADDDGDRELLVPVTLHVLVHSLKDNKEKENKTLLNSTALNEL